MPIRPENRTRYPDCWPLLSRIIRLGRALQQCENPTCRALNGHPHPITGSKVVLTVAHLDHVPENCAWTNLAALCQRCHNRHDAWHRRNGRKAVRDLLARAG